MATRRYIQGRDLIVYMDGTAIAAARSCEITVDTDMIEVSSPTSGDAREYRAGRYGWTLDVSSLVLYPDMVMNSGQAATFTCLDAKQPGKTWLTGNVLCRTAKMSATVGSLAQGSYSFIGNGPLYGDNSSQ